MISKALGAVLILAGCGGFGMMICISYQREEEMIRQLIRALDHIQYELQFRVTPLPELCQRASSACKGKVSAFSAFFLKNYRDSRQRTCRSASQR